MNTHDIERKREELIRQWQGCGGTMQPLRMSPTDRLKLVLIIAFSSLVVGSLPIIYGLTWGHQAQTIIPTEASLWAVFGERD